MNESLWVNLNGAACKRDNANSIQRIDVARTFN
jgi:hypothetical protein